MNVNYVIPLAKFHNGRHSDGWHISERMHFDDLDSARSHLAWYYGIDKSFVQHGMDLNGAYLAIHHDDLPSVGVEVKNLTGRVYKYYFKMSEEIPPQPPALVVESPAPSPERRASWLSSTLRMVLTLIRKGIKR